MVDNLSLCFDYWMKFVWQQFNSQIAVRAERVCGGKGELALQHERTLMWNVVGSVDPTASFDKTQHPDYLHLVEPLHFTTVCVCVTHSRERMYWKCIPHRVVYMMWYRLLGNAAKTNKKNNPDPWLITVAIATMIRHGPMKPTSLACSSGTFTYNSWGNMYTNHILSFFPSLHTNPY